MARHQSKTIVPSHCPLVNGSVGSDLELRAERINYEGDLTLHNIECFYNRTLIAEEYANGHASLHLHVGSVRPYAFEYFAASVGDVSSATASCSGEFPMLVWIRDLNQCLRPVHSLVRLVSLDRVYVHVRQISEISFTFGPRVAESEEVSRIGEDRKLSALRLGIAGVFPRQLEDQIIERGSEIMNAVANDEGHLIRQWGGRGKDDVRLIPNLVILDSNISRLARSVGFNFAYEVVEMFVGAFDPFTSAVKRVNHEGDSTRR